MITSNSNNERSSLLKTHLSRSILVLDGAMGTLIHEKKLNADDFGGEKFEGCNELLTLHRPEIIKSIHESYLKAGCDIIETNTFGANRLVLREYESQDKVREINLSAARLARSCADFFSASKPRFVAGSIGPGTKSLSVTGGITFDQLVSNYSEQVLGLSEGGCDYILLETSQDTRNVKAALIGIDTAFQQQGFSLPVAISITLEANGLMLAGQSVESFLASIMHRDLLYIGLNCSTGPEFMADHLRSLAKLSPFPIACVPNAGLPDSTGNYLETPKMMSNVLNRFIDNTWVNLIGGCCGTTPTHIAAFSELANTKKEVRTPPARSNSYLSGIDLLEVTTENRPVLVGERTNVIGSKIFKTLVSENKFDEASEIARNQIKKGAQILDICLSNPDRNEAADMRSFLEAGIRKIRVPIMIDSIDPEVVEIALQYCQGKAIINSINLENGETRFAQIVPKAKKYGAALVVGTIDEDPEQGMALTRKRKLEVANKAYALLVKKYGVLEEDIYWDPLTFPCASGDSRYKTSAIETIEGLKLIKAAFQKCKSVLGISNVSFGLPPAGREILNSVFLYHCVQAGLDLAIVNSEKLVRYSSITQEERDLAETLIFNRRETAITDFIEHFRDRKSATIPKPNDKTFTIQDKLKIHIIEASKELLNDDLNEALKTMSPIDIINGPLMNGMDEVGKQFNANKLIVAEVLQSAEVMKSAVQYLQGFMNVDQSFTKGKVLLATVKGDVHDIGKNLVQMILANNGYEVIDAGIKVGPEQLIDAIKTHRPDIIGLSGLLVKSAHQMVATAEDLAKSGIKTPIMVGGAALSSQFVNDHIASAYTGPVVYASNAVKSLEIAKAVLDPEKFKTFKKSIEQERSKRSSTSQGEVQSVSKTETRCSSITILTELPRVPDFRRHILRETPIEHIWQFINPLMLYGRHLGIRGEVVRELEKEQGKIQSSDEKAQAVWQAVQDVKEEYANTEVLQPQAIYQFFEASSEGNKIYLGDRAKTILEFPRQTIHNGLSLADYIRPLDNKAPKDSMAIFIVTVGKGVRQLAQQLIKRGDYLKAHIIQALALESAEAYAELLHAHIRRSWGYPDSAEMTMMQRFQAKYRGKRYSFGYPACPRLDDQKIIFDLLKPSEIGVQLTDGFMMDPEASVSSLVFHHPEASYFSVGRRDIS